MKKLEWHICNLCFCNGIFPNCESCSGIDPINPTNYGLKHLFLTVANGFTVDYTVLCYYFLTEKACTSIRYYGNRKKSSCSYTDICSQAKDITELGTLKEASKLFVPGDFYHLNLKIAPFL
jgi:hypothetical protein